MPEAKIISLRQLLHERGVELDDELDEEQEAALALSADDLIALLAKDRPALLSDTPTRAVIALLDLLAQHNISPADAKLDDDAEAFVDHARRSNLTLYMVDVDMVRSYVIPVELGQDAPDWKILEAARRQWDEAMRDSGRAHWLIDSTFDMTIRSDSIP